MDRVELNQTHLALSLSVCSLELSLACLDSGSAATVKAQAEHYIRGLCLTNPFPSLHPNSLYHSPAERVLNQVRACYRDLRLSCPHSSVDVHFTYTCVYYQHNEWGSPVIVAHYLVYDVP